LRFNYRFRPRKAKANKSTDTETSSQSTNKKRKIGIKRKKYAFHLQAVKHNEQNGRTQYPEAKVSHHKIEDFWLMSTYQSDINKPRNIHAYDALLRHDCTYIMMLFE
jgi:hypothetical protein